MGILVMYLWGFVRGAIPYIVSVPRWVWVAAAVVVGFLYYGHSVAQRTKADYDAQATLRIQQEKERQRTVADKAIHDATTRMKEAEVRAQTLEEKLNEVTVEMQKAKDAQRVCLPSGVTNKLRFRAKPRKP